MGLSELFTKFARKVSHAAGNPITFGSSCLLIIFWGLSGPLFHYSDTWQLVINTSTTIVTFLMVFLIQNTQNRDGAAIQAKLDELLRAMSEARNGFVGIENLSEEDLAEIIARCEKEAEDEQEDPEMREKLTRMHAGLNRLARSGWRR